MLARIQMDFHGSLAASMANLLPETLAVMAVVAAEAAEAAEAATDARRTPSRHQSAIVCTPCPDTNLVAWFGPPHAKPQPSNSVASKHLMLVWLCLPVGCQSLKPAHQMQARDGIDSKICCAVFLSPDCPIANAIAPSLGRLGHYAQQHDIETLLIYPRKDLTTQQVSNHAQSYGLIGRVVLDPDHRWVNSLDATVTPEAFVFSGGIENPNVLYQGRINDLYRSVGNRQEQARTHDFRNAIERSIAGNRESVSGPPAVGCTIER